MMVTLTVPESQMVEWVQQLTPTVKRSILRALIPTLDDYEALVTYGNERVRGLASRQGLDWDQLDEPRREQLIDDLLHQK
jgi:hypothetical protein